MAVVVVILLLLLAGMFLLMSRYRRASSVLAGTLALIGLLRLVFPAERLGPFAVRSRAFDVVFCLSLAGLVLALIA